MYRPSRDSYPLKFQQSWLKDTILSLIRDEFSYTQPIIAKNIISSGKNKKNLKVTPILRISSFIKTTTPNNDLTAVLTDSSHKILVRFPFHPTIVEFETLYNQRITYNTVHTLIQIKQANLLFVNRVQLKGDYNMSHTNSLGVVILEITDLRLFQQDQIEFAPIIDNSLKFIYDDDDYIKICTGPALGDRYVITDPDEYDDVVSHDEDSI
ncbi:hypothetical protein DFJ63DRAFT_316024 [Scheffersomyces coipomensis]|uniref:uncharacterized protein n=1 Tax=Scheffersomyces coipomensis TaxID=1788519 RepID=UPI00315CABA2